jgi:hypothetical protein
LMGIVLVLKAVRDRLRDRREMIATARIPMYQSSIQYYPATVSSHGKTHQ